MRQEQVDMRGDGRANTIQCPAFDLVEAEAGVPSLA